MLKRKKKNPYYTFLNFSTNCEELASREQYRIMGKNPSSGSERARGH